MTDLITLLPAWLAPALILAASIVGLGVILERAWALWARIGGIAAGDEDLLSEMVRDGRVEEARAVCESRKHPAYALVAQLLTNQSRRAQTLIERETQKLAGRLNRGLPSLGIVSTVAPLLGLFGTVTGMIKSFHAFAQESAPGAGLMGGVDEALITTCMGLFVAIPALIGYNYFVTRANQIADETEALGLRIAEELERQ